MALDEIRVWATTELIEWVGEEEDPREERGWVDPRNPWGSWIDQEPVELLLTAVEAAEMVNDFPGGVWHHTEAEAEQDVRTGKWKSVMLHVMDHEETVLELADRLAGRI